MTFIFSDDEVRHYMFKANSWRIAITFLRDHFQIKGRLKITQDLYGHARFYKLIGSDYGFFLKITN
jgi:hypothetical protein